MSFRALLSSQIVVLDQLVQLIGLSWLVSNKQSAQHSTKQTAGHLSALQYKSLATRCAVANLLNSKNFGLKKKDKNEDINSESKR